MTNKTICFFNSAKVWGGGEKWHFDMASAMQKDGIDIIFFVNKNSKLHEKLINTNIKVVTLSINNRSFLNPFKINSIKSKLIDNKIDTIIINLSGDLKVAGIAAKNAKVKNIIYRRGSAIPIKNSFLNRYIFKNIITDIIANTHATKETILQNNSKLFNPEKIKVIYNGINIEKLYQQEKTLFYKRNKDELVIGNLGRLEYQKAQHLLLDLASELKNQEFLNFKIIISGKGRLEDSLKQKCKEQNLCNHILFTGFVENIKSFYSDIDIFVLTSLWEGFGYVLAEAMAFKKAAIAFNISSNVELIDNNVTGYLIDFKDIKKMAEKIIYLSKNKEILKEMGNNAYKKVTDQFTLTKSYANLISMINTLRK